MFSDTSQTTPALALLVFVRSLGSTVGIAMGASILQNQLQINLPAAILSAYTNSDGQISPYAAIPLINTLPSPLRDEVRVAFASSLQTVWRAMLRKFPTSFQVKPPVLSPSC